MFFDGSSRTGGPRPTFPGLFAKRVYIINWYRSKRDVKIPVLFSC